MMQRKRKYIFLFFFVIMVSGMLLADRFVFAANNNRQSPANMSRQELENRIEVLSDKLYYATEDNKKLRSQVDQLNQQVAQLANQLNQKKQEVSATKAEAQSSMPIAKTENPSVAKQIPSDTSAKVQDEIGNEDMSDEEMEHALSIIGPIFVGVILGILVYVGFAIYAHVSVTARFQGKNLV